MGLLTLVPILGFSAFLARSLRLGHAQALLCAVAAIVLFTYTGGLVGVLWWSALAVCLAGSALLAFELMRRAKTGSLLVPVPMTYGLLILFSALFWLIHGKSEYLYYDEFSHWGVFTKEMLAYDAFWGADTNALHPRYPPGAPLWQYLFNVFRTPTEGTVYLGQFVLLITPFLVLWNRLRWRQVPWILSILALCLLLLTDFGHGVSSLFIDHVLAAWFIGTILCYVADRHRSIGRLAVYSAPLALLALLKGTGFLFALAAAGIIVAITLYDIWRKRSLEIGRGAWQAVAALLILIGPAALGVQAWNVNRDRIDTGHDLQAVGSIARGLSGETGADPAIRAEVTRRFVDVVLHQQLSKNELMRGYHVWSYPIRDLFTDRFRLTTASLFGIYVVWWLVFVRFVLSAESRVTWGITAAGILVTAIGYVGSLYLFYWTTPNERAVLLSSYLRYVHSIALPMALLCFAPLLPAFGQPLHLGDWRLASRRPSVAGSLFAAALAAMYVFETPYLKPIYHRNNIEGLRRQLEPATQIIQRQIGRSSLWVYLPKDMPNRFIGELMQYLLSPTPTTIERSPAFLEQGLADIVARWKDFDYIWFPNGLEPAEATKLESLLGAQSATGRMYRVEPGTSGTVTVSAIELQTDL